MLTKRIGWMLSVATVLSLGLKAGSTDDMANFIKNIKVAFTDYYAPKQWKIDTYQWNLDAELAKLIEASGRGDINEFHRSLGAFFDATRDYHTSIWFANHTTATLPIGIVHIDGGFYVAYIAPSLATNFSLKLGDKITHIDNKDVKELAFELMGKLDNPSLTDWALAARKLTRRMAWALDVIDKGPVIIKALRGDKTVIAQLVWDISYGVSSSLNKPNNNGFKTFSTHLSAALLPKERQVLENVYKHIDSRSFRVKLADVYQAVPTAANDPQALGKKESILPKLSDRIIWQTEGNNPWHAYIYLNGDNKLIGFIRIPSYSPGEGTGAAAHYAEKFGEIVAKMNDLTDVLVIDQLNNPGGSVFYLYALASMLTDAPLITPRHQFTIDSRDVWEAKNFLKQVDALIVLASQQLEPLGDADGYPVDMQFLQHMKSYFQFVVDQWNLGKTLTDPYFLFGVDHIQPHGKYRYTKKIVLLTNELDFSGGDFFPAIMQDNQRATLLGSKTSGAGGYVLSNADRNRVGIVGYSYTGSIAFRLNGEPLENLGVTPDFGYQITPNDLTSGYANFKDVINNLVSSVLN